MRFDLANVIAPLQSAILGSVFYAVISGQYNRYAIEHAPRPHFKPMSRVVEHPPDVRGSRLARYRSRYGLPLNLPRLHQPRAPRSFRPDRTAFGTHHRHQAPSGSRTLGAVPSATARRAANRPAFRASDVTLAASGGLSASNTGVNRWWVYEEHGIPGVGKAYVNVNTGNLLVSVTDLDMPERGIDLALRRTYNAMSKHDAANDDGSTPGVFGNGWTATFDAHISSPDGSTISVWDTDGARYDFDCSTSPCTSLTAGDHNKLYLDPGNSSCTWAWEKKNGTVYEFYQLGAVSSCTQYNGRTIPAALYGALGAIFARNRNNSLTFSYSFAGGDGSSYSNLAQMTVTHSDGDAVVLAFGTASADNGSGTTPTELLTATPYHNGAALYGQRLFYGYDTLGNLLEVDHPANNTGTTTPLSNGISVLPETYVLYPNI
ncbi:MAG TPA: DUF6531 domain-containing protein, partial [Candidatus Baltobacteraceae bacterium]|nr:DUF6531 domain-containing protein [Candidatus Baltobacteraceae bacterium]